MYIPPPECKCKSAGVKLIFYPELLSGIKDLEKSADQKCHLFHHVLPFSLKPDLRIFFTSFRAHIHSLIRKKVLKSNNVKLINYSKSEFHLF